MEIDNSLDPTNVKLRSPHSPTRRSEPRPIRILLRLHHNTPRPRPTILPQIPPRLRYTLILQTSPSGVQSHLVVRVEVDTLDDVYLAVVWPCYAFCPECGPYGAAVGDV